MRRIQLYLDEELDEAITRRAVHEGVAKAVVIRDALRATFPNGRSPEDPSSLLVGAYEGREDESATVDEVVYRVRLADTSFWVALAASRDARHSEAIALWNAQRDPVLVTNHIAGETWTFLRRRAGHGVAMAALALFRSGRVHLGHVDQQLETDAWRWLERHDERAYSFVDATSFAVMRSRRIREALAFDDDFGAAGFVELRP